LKQIGRGLSVNHAASSHRIPDNPSMGCPKSHGSRPYRGGRGLSCSHQSSVGRAFTKKSEESVPGYGRGRSSTVSNQGTRKEHREQSGDQGWEPSQIRGTGFGNVHDRITLQQDASDSGFWMGGNAVVVDTGVEIWEKSMKAHSSCGKETEHMKAETSPEKHFDSSVDWDAEVHTEQYEIKPKMYVPTEFKPETKAVQKPVSQTDTTDKWIAKTLQQRPAQPNEKEINTILTNLETMWHDKSKINKTDFSRYIAHEFSKSINPFALVVFIVGSAFDTHVAKTTTLSYQAMREFEKFWRLNNSRLISGSYLNEELKLQMFYICTRRHMTAFDIAARCFAMSYEGNQQFLPTVKMFVENKKFKEVSRALQLDPNTCNLSFLDRNLIAEQT